MALGVRGWVWEECRGGRVGLTAIPDPGRPPVPGFGATMDATGPNLPHSILVSSRISVISSSFSRSDAVIMLCSASTVLEPSMMRGGRFDPGAAAALGSVPGGTAPAVIVSAGIAAGTLKLSVAVGGSGSLLSRSLPSGETLVLPST